MDMAHITTTPFEKEHESPCSCCGRPMHTGAGELLANEKRVADYWYRWTDGPEVHFFLAVCPRGYDGEPVEGAGVAVLSGHIANENLVYSVVEPQDAPWSGFGAFGPVLARVAVLSSNWQPGVFELVDAVMAKEARLSSRILNLPTGLN